MARGNRPGWGELLGRIGRSAVELWRAELHSLQGELGDTGRLAARAAVLAAIAGFLAFWALGLLFAAVVAALTLALPVWASAAIVLAVVAVAALLVARAARDRFRSLESPARTVKRRVGDHVAWWQDQLLPPEESGEPEERVDRGPSPRRPASGGGARPRAPGAGEDEAHEDDARSSREVDEGDRER